MKVNYFLVCILLLITLSTCTKFGKNIYVDGRVYNPVTGQGIGGVTVRLYRSKIDSEDPLGSDSKTLKTVTTDENGYYKVEYLASPFNQAFVQVNYAGYYPLGWTENGSLGSNGIKKGKRNHLDYEMAPYGNLILNIQNVNCGGFADTMYFRKKWLENPDFEGFYSTPRTGCYSYTSPSPSQVPMGTYVYEMKVIRLGITSYVYDTIFVPEAGIVTINMDY